MDVVAIRVPDVERGKVHRVDAGPAERHALVLQALNRSISHAGVPRMHHSDRGSTYTSNAYRDLLLDYQILSSMGAKGYCYDNAHVESFFSTLKSESRIEQKQLTREEANEALFEYIEAFYNTYRIHTALGCSPKEYRSWN